jgi:hypothetical protein
VESGATAPRMIMTMRTVLKAGMLGIATSAGVYGAIFAGPDSWGWVFPVSLLSLPGFIVRTAIFRAMHWGPHRTEVAFVLVTNSVFYGLLWWIVLRVWRAHKTTAVKDSN